MPAKTVPAGNRRGSHATHQPENGCGSAIDRPLLRSFSELFGGLLKGFSHIVPRCLCTLLHVPPCAGSGFANLFQLVAGYLLLGLEVSHLLFPAGLGLVFQGVSFFIQPFGFGGIAAAATDIARLLFVVFLALFVIALIMGRRGTAPPL
jgi:uncharacterized membrane protein YtjA (UPF0391 family)